MKNQRTYKIFSNNNGCKFMKYPLCNHIYSLIYADKSEILDNKGEFIPNSNIPIPLDILGSGGIVATGDGNPSEMNILKIHNRATFKVLALAGIRPKDRQQAKIYFQLKPKVWKRPPLK